MNEMLFRAISNDEYERFKHWSIDDYAESMLQEGQFASLEAAKTAAVADFEEGLPNGLETEENYLVIAENSYGENVGLLWYETTNNKRGFIEDIVILPQHRRRGYATMVLEKLGDILISRSIYRIFLHVFESNLAARKLYENAGFTYIKNSNDEPGSLYMLKELQS